MLKCVVIPAPGREIPGILPNNRRISEEMTLCLNKREILKCMKHGTVYGIAYDGSRVILTDNDSINHVIMDKVEEKKEQFQAQQTTSVLDNAGITRQEKRDIVHNVEQVKPVQNNNNQNRNKNNRNQQRQNYPVNNTPNTVTPEVTNSIVEEKKDDTQS
ncbi:MAG: hypothetical protein PHC62_00505 [Candidatus Izemoplasmatales bacterium]|nr:hypothetical protein [Candidatus Izemoplasmatales bacterium]